MCGDRVAGSGHRRQHRHLVAGSFASTLLVSTQLAVSLVLVVAAGLFLRTSAELARRNVGTTRDRVLVAAMNAPMTRYTSAELVEIHERVVEAVRALPGVEQAAISDITPAGDRPAWTAICLST